MKHLKINSVSWRENIPLRIGVKLIFLAVFCLFRVHSAYAGLLQPDVIEKINERAGGLGTRAGFSGQTPAQTIADLIKAFLGLLGVIFIILIIIAGFNWMTAGGEEEKIRKAKDKIWRAVIGLIIIVSAYAITYFVFTKLPAG